MLTGTNSKESKLGILSQLTRGNEFTIDKPTSYREVLRRQNRDLPTGRFAKGYHDISAPEISSSATEWATRKARNYGVDSTAIDHATYNPNDGSLNIAYTSNPGKEYKFKADEQDVIDWMNAPSKGRITQEWRTTHRYPGF